MGDVSSWLLAGGVGSAVGLLVLAALDSSVVFFLPLAVDILVIYLVADAHELLWLYPLLATVGSLAGAAATYWIGNRVGEGSLERFMSRAQVEGIQDAFKEKSGAAMAVPALIPPPFPFTAYILAAGALEVSPASFFPVLVGMRGLRFAAEGVLATIYGRSIVDMMESGAFKAVMVGLIALAVAGTAYSVYHVIRYRPAGG